MIITKIKITKLRHLHGQTTTTNPQYLFTISCVLIGVVVLLAPRVAPTLKNLTALNSTAVIVEWSPIDDPLNVVSGYMIMWHREGHKQNGTNNITDSSITSFILAGLKRYTNYTVKIAAYNSAGVSPYNNMTSVQTGPDGKE